MKEKEIKRGEVIIYKSKDGPKLEVRLEEDTVWLDAHLMARLFDVNRPAIVKHINNIYKSSELDKNLTCSILEQVAADGKIRKMNLYNLDMIISVGYRVNSKRATEFRIWATKTLKEHLVKGYTINEKQLLQASDKLLELQKTITFLQEQSKHELIAGQEQEILNLLAHYARSLTLLEQYDNAKIPLKSKSKGTFVLHYNDAQKIIAQLKKELIAKKEAGDLFGKEVQQKFQSILNNIYQTFDKKELYPSLEEKAAHLLYLIIKDHPFVDGNKRIASFLFVYFLNRNNALYRTSGERKINDNTLTTLALLIAISKPEEKDTFIKLITNLLYL
ncbi:MAG: RhuM family protein [Desulfurella sp.]|uniref:RhuM family protein n=1 Tax=Desulfurella sp. TaxID=1962857 RepID=UPI003D0CFB98